MNNVPTKVSVCARCLLATLEKGQAVGTGEESSLERQELIPQIPLGREESARQTKGGKCSFLLEELWLTRLL